MGLTRMDEFGWRSLSMGFSLDLSTTTLMPASRNVLDQIRAEVAARPGAEVQVTGHTDTVGSDATYKVGVDGPEAGQTLEQHLYLVDPLGRWMWRSPVRPEPQRVKRDLDKLLRAASGLDQAGRP